MVTQIPTNYTWVHKDIPTSRQLNTRLSDVANFLLNPPMIRLRKLVAQSVPTATDTPVSWDTVEVENYDMWTSTLPTRITPSVPGWYVGSAGITYAPGTTGIRRFDIRKNNAATAKVIRITWDAPSDISFSSSSRGNTFLESFNGTTDYIEVVASQNNGTALNLLVDVIERQPECSLRWVAAL